MRVACDICRVNPNPLLDYSIQHLFNPLSQIFPSYSIEDKGGIFSDTTHLFILDICESLESRYRSLVNLRQEGVKVVAFTFDPANFIRLRRYVESGSIDKVVVFDQRFYGRFNCKMYVTDYFFNQNLFPITNKENNGKVCIYGTISDIRPNDYQLDVADVTDPPVKSLIEVYSNIQKYNGVATHDAGLDETRTNVDHYNKARGVETLMCGRVPYCKPGINTKNYNRFLRKYEEIPTPHPIYFDQEEIFKINSQVLQELKFELENI